MHVTRIMANLRVADVEASKSFYTGYLGLSTEGFNMGCVARYTSGDAGANVQLVTHDATAPEDSVISVHTDDVESAYEEAQELGYGDRVPDNDRAVGCAPILRPRIRSTSSTSCAVGTDRAAACDPGRPATVTHVTVGGGHSSSFATAKDALTCLGCRLSRFAGSSEGLDPGGSVRSEDSHRAKCCTKPVAQHQQAAGELFHLPVRAQYRYVSCQIFHPRRLHRPPEPGPVARSECIRHDEVQAPAQRGRRTMPEQHLRAGTPHLMVPSASATTMA